MNSYALPCTIDSSYAWDALLCWSLGPIRRITLCSILDRCLPVPTTCDMMYAGNSCPESHLAVSGNSAMGTFTTLCCPRYERCLESLAIVILTLQWYRDGRHLRPDRKFIRCARFVSAQYDYYTTVVCFILFFRPNSPTIRFLP